jgi:hypothetical protein
MKASFPPYSKAAVADSKPSPTHEVSPVEAKLRTAMQYLYHSRLLLDEAMALVSPPEPVDTAEILRERLESVDDDQAAAA